MPRLFVEPGQLAQEEVTLRGPEARYLLSVLRLSVGDELIMFDGNGNEADARVVDTARGRATLGVGKTRAAQVPPAPPLTLIVALLKSNKMDWVVQKATELGVTTVVPCLCARSIPQPSGSTSKSERWQRIAREAARQSGRADLPVIAQPVPFGSAIDRLPSATDRRVLFHESAPRRADDLFASADGFVVATGPEGGFSAAEVTKAEKAGFALAGLGGRVLRAETAAIIACAAASVLAPRSQG